MIKKDQNLNDKEQKCSFTTMAGSNTAFNHFGGQNRQVIPEMKDNFEEYLKCSEHESEYYHDRTNESKAKTFKHSHSLNDFLYKCA